MLSDIAGQQLAAIYILNNKVADDDKLCEAFLRDYCGECRREIAALSAAVRWGVPKSLREASQTPASTLRVNLARRLEENQGLDADNALWAVDVWAAVIRPANGGWPAAPKPAPVAPVVRTPVPAHAENQVVDWSQSPPPGVSTHYFGPAVAASVLSPPVGVPAAPPQKPVHPQAPVLPQSPVHPAHQPMPGIPFAAAAAAFLAGEKSPDLATVQAYLKMQLKIRKPKALMEEIQAASVAPGIAKNMVNRVRRSKALKRLILAILILITGFVMLGNGNNGHGEVTALGMIGFLVFVAGGGYSLWSVINIVRFS